MQNNIFVRTESGHVYIGSLAETPTIEHREIILSFVSLQPELDREFLELHLNDFLNYNIDAVFSCRTNRVYMTHTYSDLLATQRLYNGASCELQRKVDGITELSVNRLCTDYKIGDMLKFHFLKYFKFNTYMSHDNPEPLRIVSNNLNLFAELGSLINIFTAHNFISSVEQHRYADNALLLKSLNASYMSTTLNFTPDFFKVFMKYQYEYDSSDIVYKPIYEKYCPAQPLMVEKLHKFGSVVFTNTPKRAIILEEDLLVEMKQNNLLDYVTTTGETAREVITTICAKPELISEINDFIRSELLNGNF